MAPRIGFTLAALRGLDPSACATDARVVMKSGDELNLGILLHNGDLLNLRLCGSRELRLLGKQMFAIADHLETSGVDPFEVVLP